jgi:hypothetical protein
MKEKKKSLKEAKVDHIVFWPITCIRPLWYYFKPRPILAHSLLLFWHIDGFTFLLAFGVFFKNPCPFQPIVDSFFFGP